MFSAVKDRGNVTNANFGGSLAEFDILLKALDKEGAIEENMLFLNRGTALEFDDMLGAIGGGYASSVLLVLELLLEYLTTKLIWH